MRQCNNVLPHNHTVIVQGRTGNCCNRAFALRTGVVSAMAMFRQSFRNWDG